MKKQHTNIRSQYLDSPGIKSIWLLINPWSLFIFVAYLFFISYMVLLSVTGFFHDWQELVTEPYFILRGLKNYTDISTHHAPLLTEFLAIIYSITGTDKIVRIVLLIFVASATAFLTFYATDKLAGKRAGLFSILLLAIFWPFYGGINFWFDTFLPIFYLIAFVLVIERHSPRWMILAGISMGISFLIKQTGGVVAIVIFMLLLARPNPLRTRLKECLVFSIGVLVPIIGITLWYASKGQLGDAYYWIIKYNVSDHYVKLGGTHPPINDVIRLVAIIVPIVSFLVGATFSKAKRQLISWDFLLALSMGFCASFTIFPRWERWHVIPSIPFLVISLVLSCKLLLTTTDVTRRIQTNKIIKAILIVWVVVIFIDVGTFYPPQLIEKIVPNFTRMWPLRSYTPPVWIDEDVRRYWHDVPAIGKYLQETTNENDRIFVWGWTGSRLYFESDRLPAGKFYYALPWFTCLPRFHKDLLMGFERDHPRYVVVLKRRYTGTPTLKALGVDLEKKGYQRLTHLEERFHGVVLWRSSDLS